MVLGVGAAWADADEITLKVKVQAGTGGTVAVSKFNTSTQDGDFTSGSKTVEIWSSSRCNNAASANLPWSNLSTRTNKSQRNEDKVNYAYIAAKANPGYRFIGWADAAGTDPRVSPASTAITTKYSTISNYHRDWRFETVTDNGTWNGIVKYAVTNYGLWAEHYDTKNLYAYFAKENTVTFSVPGDATVTPTSKTVLTGDPFGALPTPTRPGYTFEGWYTAAEGGTKIEPTSIKADNDQTLYAHWTANTITISFVDNERPQTGEQAATFASISNVTVGGDMPALSTSDYKKDWYSQVEGEKYFAGWYTRINGGGERIYTGVEDNDHHLTLATPGKKCTFTSDVTLYAHYTHVKHVAHWDYTYTNGINSWINLTEDNAQDRIKYAKLTFMKANNDVIKVVYFQAADVTNLTGTPTKELNTHTVTKGQFHLQTSDTPTTTGATVNGTKSENGDAGDWNVYFTDEELSQFAKYNFEPIHTPASQGIEEAKANNWMRTTDPGQHDTWFTFVGASDGNTADLSWTVTLTNLKVFPEKVIAKPLFDAATSGQDAIWTEISQLAALDGVRCDRTDDGSNPNQATYTGKYPVWKQGSTAAYGYALGMVGFELHGKTIYMNTENPGQFDTHFNSATADNPESKENRTSQWPSTGEEAQKKFPDIVYTIDASNIPVIRFLPGSAEGVKLDGGTPEIVWGSAAINNFSKTYFATRPGYTFMGWSEDEPVTGSSKVWGDETYIPTKAATFYPVWKDATAPVIVPQAIEYTTDHSVTIKVNVTDAESGVSSVQYAVSESETAPVEGWEEMTNLGESKYSAVIDNVSKVYIFVKATNTVGVTSDPVRTPLIQVDRQAPVVTSDKHVVCNGSVTVTVTDNVGISSISVTKNENTYEPTITGTDKAKTFTLTEAGTYKITTTDAAGNVSTELEVTIHAAHNWGGKVEAKDPTAKEIGSTVAYHKCSYCGAYAYDNNGEVGSEMTEEQVAQSIIPAGSVLVKNGEGTTKAWAEDLNAAITKISAENGNNIKLSKNTDVTGGTISGPTSPATATLDLNGYGLLVDGNPADGQGGHEESITGNEKVTILLNDGGETEYNNKSKVTGSPIKYHRSFAATTRANKWQALYLPFDAGTVSAPENVTYTFGKPKGVKITAETASLQIDKDVESLEANKHYFVKSSNGEVLINKTTDLYGYTTPEATTVPTLDGGTGTFAIKGSLNADNNKATAENTYWVLTNGGAFNWAKAGTHQRPYHWVIYYTPAAGGEEARPTTLSIVETEDDPTAIRDITVDEAEAAIYSLSGQRMPAGATLPSGIYVRNGKKIYVK